MVLNADYTSECSDDLVWSEPTVSDTCDDKPSLEMEETQQLDYCGLGIVTRTWTATDCAGNTSVESQTITIEDTTNPVITGVGEDFSVECPEGFEFSEPTFSDNCTEDFYVSEYTGYCGDDVNRETEGDALRWLCLCMYRRES